MEPNLTDGDFVLTLFFSLIVIPLVGGVLVTFSCGKGRHGPMKNQPGGGANYKGSNKSTKDGKSKRDSGDSEKGSVHGQIDEDHPDNSRKSTQISREERISRSQRLKRMFSAKKREMKASSERESKRAAKKYSMTSTPVGSNVAPVASVTNVAKGANVEKPQEIESVPEEIDQSQTKLLGARVEEEEEPPPFESAFGSIDDMAHPAATPEVADDTGAVGGSVPAAPTPPPPTAVELKLPPQLMPGSELDVRMSDAVASEKQQKEVPNKNLVPVQQVRPISPAATPTGAAGTPSPTPSPAVTPVDAGEDDKKEQDEDDSDKSSKKSSKKHKKKKKHNKHKKKHKKAKPTPNVATALIPLPQMNGATRYENLYPQVLSRPENKEVTGIDQTVTEDKCFEITKEQFLTGVNPRKMAEFLKKRPPVMLTGIEDEPSERKFTHGVSSRFVGLPKTQPLHPRVEAKASTPRQVSLDPTQQMPSPASTELAPTQYSGVRTPTNGTQGTQVSFFDRTQKSTTTAPTQVATNVSQGADGPPSDRRIKSLKTTQKTDTNIDKTQTTCKKTYATAATQPDTIVGTPVGSRDAPTQRTRVSTVGPTQAGGGTTMEPTQNTTNVDGTQIPEGSIEQTNIHLPKTHIDPTQVISFNEKSTQTHVSMDATQVRTNPTLELAATQKSCNSRKSVPTIGIDRTQNGPPPTMDATQSMHSRQTIIGTTGLTTKCRTKSLADPTQPDPTTTSAGDTDTVAAVKEIGPTQKSSFRHSFPEGTTQPTLPNSIPSINATQWGQTILPTTQPSTTANTAEQLVAKGSGNYDKCPVEKKTPSESNEMVTATRITLNEGYPKPHVIPKTPKEKKIADDHLKCKPDEYPTFKDIISDWGTADDAMPLMTAKASTESPVATPPLTPSPAAMSPVHPDTMKLRQLEEEDERKHIDRRKKLGAKKKADDEKKRREFEDLERERKRKLEEDRVTKLRANAPKPRAFARTTYEDKIATGKIVRRKHDYPTMNDIKSDWDTSDTDSTPGKDKINGEK